MGGQAPTRILLVLISESVYEIRAFSFKGECKWEFAIRGFETLRDTPEAVPSTSKPSYSGPVWSLTCKLRSNYAPLESWSASAAERKYSGDEVWRRAPLQSPVRVPAPGTEPPPTDRTRQGEDRYAADVHWPGGVFL